MLVAVDLERLQRYLCRSRQMTSRARQNRLYYGDSQADVSGALERHSYRCWQSRTWRSGQYRTSRISQWLIPSRVWMLRVILSVVAVGPPASSACDMAEVQ